MQNDEATTQQRSYCEQVRSDMDRYRERLRRVVDKAASAQRTLDDAKRDRNLAAAGAVLAIGAALSPLGRAISAGRASVRAIRVVAQGGKISRVNLREIAEVATGIGAAVVAIEIYRTADKRIDRAARDLEALAREADLIQLGLTDLSSDYKFRGCDAVS